MRRLGEPLHADGAKMTVLEQIAEDPPSSPVDDDRFGFCGCLQPRRAPFAFSIFRGICSSTSSTFTWFWCCFLVLLPVAVLQDGWQYHLAHHPGRGNPLIGCIVVTGGYGHDQIEARQNKEPLAAIADRAPKALEA